MAAYNLSKAARAKIAGIYEYSLLTFGERQADAYLDSLFETFDRLADMPNMGRSWRDWRDRFFRACVLTSPSREN